MPRAFHDYQEFLPLVWVDEGKAKHSAYLLPVPATSSQNGVKLVQVHWDIANYDAWVPARSVAIDEPSGGGRRSSRRREQGVMSDEEIEKRTLEALSILIGLIDEMRRKEQPAKVKQERKPARRRASLTNENFALVWARDGATTYPAHLLPEKSLSNNGVSMVRIYWVTSGYDAWVPASHVAMPAKGVGQRRKSKSQQEELSDEKKEALTLEALSVLLSLVDEGEEDESEFSSVQPDPAMSRNAATEELPDEKSSPVRRRETDLLLDALTHSAEPIFDNKGRRPRKTPQVLSAKCDEAAPTKPNTKTPVKANAGKVQKRKPTKGTDKVLIKAEKYRSYNTKTGEASESFAAERALKVWSAGDDRLLLEKYAEFGPKWALICTFISDSNYHGCRARFKRLTSEPKKRDAGPSGWSREEDSILQQKHAIYGNKWRHIAKSFPLRDGEACRRRFVKLNPGWRRATKKRPKKSTGRPRLTEQDRRILRAYVPVRYVWKGND